MHVTMSITAFRDVATATWPNTPARAIGSRGFVLLGVFYSLSIVAFVEPIEYAWHRSVYDESDDMDRSDASARDGYLQRQIALGAMGLLGAVALAWPTKRLRTRGVLAALCAAYIAWCLATCFWSDDVSISIRRLMALLCEVLAGMAIATRTSPRQFAWFVFACTLTWFGLGLMAELSLGALQPWRAGYRFKGIFHPNIMSVVCALLIMSALYLSKGIREPKRILQSIAGVAFVFLVLTGSRTALGAMLVTLIIVWSLSGAWNSRVAIVGCIGLALGLFGAASAVGLLNVTSDWVAMGRQDNEVDSLSSRVPLWQELISNYASRKPFGGYGYGAFWSPGRIVDV
jgi:O-antigen ligase